MSTHHGTHRFRRVRSATAARAVILPALVLTLGCWGDPPHRRRVIEDTSERQLAGTWSLTLQLDRPMSFSTDAKSLPRRVTGTVALLEDHSAQLSFAEMKSPTHIGVYDIDLDSLELAPWESGIVPSLVARAVFGAAGSDSLYIVINPETPGHSLRLSGVLASGGATGVWIAESPFGGGGTFLLRRKSAQDDNLR